MLNNTFCHIPGVGPKTERRLWHDGVLTWEDSLNFSFSAPRVSEPLFRDHVEKSILNLERRNPGFFSDSLRSGDLWRIFSEFRDKTAYLDIETNGYVGPYGYITAISLYDGRSIKYYIRGENLDDFRRDIEPFDVVVTYNGKCFDIPFIESHMGFKMPQAHIDLRFILRDLGFKGGLKGCERSLGIRREGMEGLDGYFAVLLWREYRKRKNPRALETLLAYNIQDTISLEALMVAAYNMKIGATPFSERSLPVPTLPVIPLIPDADTISRIKHEHRIGL